VPLSSGGLPRRVAEGAREAMADHLDAPGLNSPAGDARVDITDLYAFQKPGDASKSILVLNVNPLAPSHADEFRHQARYEILIDTNADAMPDIKFRITFTPKTPNGAQFARVVRVAADEPETDDPDDLDVHFDGLDERARLLFAHAPVSFGSQATITDADGYRFYAGFRSDPFFFDLIGFLHGFAFTGSDFFIDKNVFGIALEVPNRAGLGANPHIGVWARTLIPATMQPDHFVQADQMGRPAINTVFNHGNDKNVFNVTQPVDQRAGFESSFIATLAGFGHPAAEAKSIAELLLPDILTYDYGSAAGFLNGRKLTDDVIDIELNLVSNGAVTTDKVGPHTDYLSTFPFLGAPH
jgi:hypothetical protein